ncbi:MAG: hypothetical protein BJ554DRAFT_5265, partial [Olpidium bornovanus]
VKRLAKEILQLEREKNAETGAFRDYDAAPLEVLAFEGGKCVCLCLTGVGGYKVRLSSGREKKKGPLKSGYAAHRNSARTRYHGKIILPQEYPFKPPSIILLTVGAHARENPTLQTDRAVPVILGGGIQRSLTVGPSAFFTAERPLLPQQENMSQHY